MDLKVGSRVFVMNEEFYSEDLTGRKGTVVRADVRLVNVALDGFDYSNWGDSMPCHVFYIDELKSLEPEKVEIPVLLTEECVMPTYGSTKAAGADLRADIPGIIELKPLQRVIVPTGVQLELPEGYEAQVRPRSGLAAKKGLTVLNSPGTIDEDYRGEVKAILINLSDKDIFIEPNERIAQLVIAPYVQVDFVTKTKLSETERGEGGLGSTGVK